MVVVEGREEEEEEEEKRRRLGFESRGKRKDVQGSKAIPAPDPPHCSAEN